MRKQIAVFICAISFDNQRRVLQGILERAKELDTDVFIFTCHVNYKEDTDNKIGAFNVMMLPDIKQFDGVIIMKNSIHYAPIADRLVEKILKSNVPAVSIDETIKGMHNISISNYGAQKKIVEDLIRKQKLTKINYVTGIISNWEGKERFKAYKDAMEENGLQLSEKRIYYGNYDAESGQEAVLHFLKNNKELPQAIVFANDVMAIGGIEKLSEFGYQVPDDLYVTGFDKDDKSQIYMPQLTTVDRRQEDMGILAVNIIEKGEAGETYDYLEPSIVLGESSGYADNLAYTMDELRRYFTAKNSVIQQAVDTIKHMSLDLSGLKSLKELYEKMHRYIRQSDMKSFYLCICDEESIFQAKNISIGDEIDLGHVNTEYTTYVSIPVAYQNGEFKEFGRFKSKKVLPWEYREQTEASFYIVSSLYYRNLCFGYCISEGSEFVMRSELSSSWVANIGIGLENIRKWMLLNQMVNQLNSMRMYDMLTQIYNRGGFYYYAEKLLNKSKHKNKHAYILFLDLDGLKKINDNLGHEYGDAVIKEMADILKESLPVEALPMRYGGDEFVVFGICSENSEAEKLIEVIQKNIALHNEFPNRKFYVSVSVGYSVFETANINNLECIIEQADMKMYEDKKKRKKCREDRGDIL